MNKIFESYLQPKDPDYEISTRNHNRIEKRELGKFRVKLNNLGPVYRKIVKMLSDDDVSEIRRKWSHSIRLNRNKTIKDIIDYWVDNEPDAKSIKRMVKLDVLLE
jgi:hypothetical protein